MGFPHQEAISHGVPSSGSHITWVSHVRKPYHTWVSHVTKPITWISHVRKPYHMGFTWVPHVRKPYHMCFPMSGSHITWVSRVRKLESGTVGSAGWFRSPPNVPLLIRGGICHARLPANSGKPSGQPPPPRPADALD
eukprot:3417209-Prymnesium_polylepis.1